MTDAIDRGMDAGAFGVTVADDDLVESIPDGLDGDTDVDEDGADDEIDPGHDAAADGADEQEVAVP